MDILFYGVGDNVYYDLYQALRNSQFYKEFPEEIIILFTQKVIGNYNAIREKRKEEFLMSGVDSDESLDLQIINGEIEAPLMQDIHAAISQVMLDGADVIHLSSMFADKKTFMFADENEHSLSPEAKKYLEGNKDHIENLKKVLGGNFYNFFMGFFERIFVSDFMNFSIGNKTLERTSMQVAVRSTSHVDSEEFTQ